MDYLFIVFSFLILSNFSDLVRARKVSNHTKTHVGGYFKFEEVLDNEDNESGSGSGYNPFKDGKFHEINATFVILPINKKADKNMTLKNVKNLVGSVDNDLLNHFKKWDDIGDTQTKSEHPKENRKFHSDKKLDKTKSKTVKEKSLSNAINNTNNRSFNASNRSKSGVLIANITYEKTYKNNGEYILRYKHHKHSPGSKRTKSSEKDFTHRTPHKMGASYRILSTNNTTTSRDLKEEDLALDIEETKTKNTTIKNKLKNETNKNENKKKKETKLKYHDNDDVTENVGKIHSVKTKPASNILSEMKTKNDIKEELEAWKNRKHRDRFQFKHHSKEKEKNASIIANLEQSKLHNVSFTKPQEYLLQTNKTVVMKFASNKSTQKENVTNKNTSMESDKLKEEEALERNLQKNNANSLKEELRKIRFKNGATGHVKSGQEFAYISQCGLYTEPQNVSFVQHSWVTKTYSPYFYLYEKPKKYEKCKPSAWMNGTDMRGSVFLSFEVKSLHGSNMENNAKICERYCCKEPRCAAWVMRFQQDATSNCPPKSYCCWLKTDIPKAEPNDDCVSGVVHREHYKHPPIGMRSAVPLGALGTGSFEMRADGTFHEWTIENQSPGGSAKLSKTSLEMMLLGVRVKKGKKKTRSAVLRTHAPHGFESVESMTYSGAHPVSRFKIDFHKSMRKDIDMTLYAYSAFHPRDPVKSATPAVAFSLDIKNPSNEELDVAFMLNMPFGYNDDTIRRGNNFAEIAYTRLVTAADCQMQCANKSKCMSWTTNGPFSCMLKDGMPLHGYEYGIISGLKGDWSVTEDLLNCKRPGFYPQSGDISLYPITSGSETTSYTVADDPENIWSVFKKTGSVNNDTQVNATGLNGAISVRTKIKPKESKILTIIFSWYFPNKDIADERVGNFYNMLFKSSVDAAKTFEKDLISSLEDVNKWQTTIMTPESLNNNNDKRKEKEKKDHKENTPSPKASGLQNCDIKSGVYNIFPECLQDIFINSMSTFRTGMWMENGRWRQWEAYDCANMDPVHVDFHRIMPYIMMYPEIVKQLMLAWADHQLSNGMIQESLSIGCLEETSREGIAGGRLMTDVNVGFVVQAYMVYSWTNDTSFFDEIYPFAERATYWLMNDATKGTGLPYRKPDTYDLFELEKYDHCAFNSIMFLLALKSMKTMSALKNDKKTLNDVTKALEHAEERFNVEMWDENREFYRAWFDDEWSSPGWLMSDIMYGQVWAYTLGLGDLVDRDKIKQHLKKEQLRNDSPFGLRAISKSDVQVSVEDTSVILGEDINSCKSLENVTKTESIWMSSSTDWSVLQVHLGMEPKEALEQAIKSLNHYRVTLRDEWNIHGLTSSEHYGLDGLPWATSHYTFHLVLWHLPIALSGQLYYAPNGTIKFSPKYEVPYLLPFYIPTCMGSIEAKEEKTGGTVEVLYKFKVSSGTCSFNEITISDASYGKSPITIEEGETIEWSAPKKSKKDIVKAMLDQLKH